MSGLQLKSKVEERVEAPVIPVVADEVACAGAAAVSEPARNPTAEPPPLPPRAATVAAARPAAVSAGSGRSLAGPVAVILVLVLLLGAVVGSGWYLLNRGGESALAAKAGGLAREAALASPATPMPSIPGVSISEPSVVAAMVEVAAPELDEEAMFRAAYDIDWPVLVLTGMVAGATPKHTSAILNGNLVAAQESIEGATLIEIRDGGAVLEYERTRKFIRVGEST